jgi:hypothetical protein
MNRHMVAAFKPEPNGRVQLTACCVQFCDGYFCDFASFGGRATFLNARSAPFSDSSATASRAASMKRLYCAGSSGPLNPAVSFLFLTAFLACPDIGPPPFLCGIALSICSRLGHPHSAFAAKRTRISRLCLKSFLKSRNAFFQCCNAFRKFKKVCGRPLHPSQHLRAASYLNGCGHG